MASAPLALPIYRVSLIREGTIRYDRQMQSSTYVAQLLQEYLVDVDREHFVVILVDQKNRLIGINTAFIGSLTASLIHPRVVSL
jgi:DNA repair protein RadC